MGQPLSHDEHMYLTAGQLIQDHAMYKDFAYLQMPYLPMIYGITFKITQTQDYLFWGRLWAFIFMGMAATCLFLICQKLSQNVWVASLSVCLLLFNKLLMYSMSYAWNNIMPMAFTLLGLYFILISISSKKTWSLGIFLSGLFLAVAIGGKLFYIATIPPFILILALYPKSMTFRNRAEHLILPFVVGVAIGLLPAFYYLITRTDTFLFNNLGYHTFNTLWRQEISEPHTLTFLAKLRFAKNIVRFPSNIALMIGMLFMVLLTIKKEKSTRETVLVVLLILFSSIIIFVPTPLQVQYFCFPMPYVIILLSCLYNTLPTQTKNAAQVLLTCCVIISIIYAGPKMLRAFPHALNAQHWPSTIINQTSHRIKQHMGPLRPNDRLATLVPLYAIESGIPTYKELATGSFLYRIGNLIPDKKHKKYVGTSEKTLHNTLAENPPKAILVGFEDKFLEAPFVQYAQKNHYRKVKGDFNGGTLYIR